MKQLLLGLALATTLGATAQIANLGSAVPLLAGDEPAQKFFPVLSADGSNLLFSAADYSNLSLYNFDDGYITLICTEKRSGLDAQFTADGRRIVYVSQKADENGRNMRTLRCYNIEEGSNVTIGEPARFISRPAIARDGGICAQVDGKRRTVAKTSSVAVRTEGSTLYITKNGEEKAYSPAGECAGYLWASLSPDGTRAMFFAAGKGIYITDMEGNVVATPGKYEAPVWFGNNHIIAMNATDDGHQYSSSQILILTADGTTMQEITRPESMAMYPTASFDASKLVYSTIDGRLYQMNITLK